MLLHHNQTLAFLVYHEITQEVLLAAMPLTVPEHHAKTTTNVVDSNPLNRKKKKMKTLKKKKSMNDPTTLS